MKKSTTSKVSEGQQEQVNRVIIDAVSKGVRGGVKKLAESGILNASNFQRVLAQGDTLAAHLIAQAKEKFAELAENIIGRLKLISGTEKITIKATDGQATIANAEDVFPGWIDSDFENYGINVPGEAKPETPVQVFEMIKNGTFQQIFGGFGENLDRLCLTQTQIIEFCRSHVNWLRTDGYATFFLFKENDEFFVANVLWDEGCLEVSAFRLSDVFVWYAVFRHRIVVPQL